MTVIDYRHRRLDTEDFRVLGDETWRNGRLIGCVMQTPRPAAEVPHGAGQARVEECMMARKRQKFCRACKKRPVWRGGDVKDPGPYCKKCYHKHVWPEKRATGPTAAEPPPDRDYDHCPECGVEADVCGGGICPNCRFAFNNALYWWFVE